MQVTEWFNYWLYEIKSMNLKPKSIMMYENVYNNYISSFIGEMELQEVKTSDVRNIIKWMDKKGYSTETMNKAKMVMQGMYESAVDEDVCDTMPLFKKIKAPSKKSKERRVLTALEQDKFVEYVKSKNHRFTDEFLLALETGFRVGELTALEWRNIDFENRLITIDHNIVNKSAKEFIINETPKTDASNRTIRMTDKAYEILIKRKNVVDNIVDIRFKDFVFLHKGMPITNQRYDSALKTVCNRIGIEPISMHTLRHSFATRCIEKGIRPKTLQNILGHSKIELTMNLYVHATQDEIVKEMKKLEMAV